MSPPPLDDDALSADLDGEAGDDLHDQIAADPEAQARQGALRAAADEVRRPVPPLDDDVVDALVGQAMAAGDEQAVPVEAARGRDAATPIPLAPRRRGRNAGRGGRRWLVAAVVVVLAAIGLGLIRNGLDESRRADTASTATRDESAPSRAGDSSGGEKLSAAPDETTSTSGHGAVTGEQPPTTVNRFTSLPQLGSYQSAAELRRALRTSVPAGRPTTSDEETLAAANRCAVTVENQMETDRAAAAATATLDGRPVLVYELRAAPPSSSQPVDLVVAVDREACTPALSFYRDR